MIASKLYLYSLNASSFRHLNIFPSQKPHKHNKKNKIPKQSNQSTEIFIRIP